jgi:hypothetical protein
MEFLRPGAAHRFQCRHSDGASLSYTSASALPHTCQLIATSSNICYLLMFAVSLASGQVRCCARPVSAAWA